MGKGADAFVFIILLIYDVLIIKGLVMLIADLRKEYRKKSLSCHEVNHDPILQFKAWFMEALSSELPEPNAMCLSTVTKDNRPASRIVLLKECDERGFTWFTNYKSHKGQELQEFPHAALLFYWHELERQVRIQGRVEQLSVAENDNYFQSRPLASRLGAIASMQSEPIDSREQLEARYAQVVEQYGEHPVRPAHWGGYRLVPDYLEFWQGRPSRLHDRIAFVLGANGTWEHQRLQP